MTTFHSDPSVASTRFSGYVHINRLRETPCFIVGCGAIGRQIALQLAAMGARTLTLIDPDTVDELNIGTQGWGVQDLQMPKVTALGQEISTKFNFYPETEEYCWPPALELYLGHRTEVGDGETNDPKEFYQDYPEVFKQGFHERYTPTIFFAVDSMDARQTIFDYVRNATCNIIDTRMGLNTCRIISAGRSFGKDLSWYKKTLFSSNEAEQAPCTMKSTLYCANIAAGFAVSQFIESIRSDEGRADVDFLQHNMLINIPNGLLIADEE